jgi:hypothetical protein
MAVGGVVAMAIEQGGGGAQRQLIYAVVGTISLEENSPLAKNSRIPTKTIISGSELLTPIPSYQLQFRVINFLIQKKSVCSGNCSNQIMAQVCTRSGLNKV